MSSSIQIPFEYLWDSKRKRIHSALTLHYKHQFDEESGMLELIPNLTIMVYVPHEQPGVKIERTLELQVGGFTAQPPDSNIVAGHERVYLGSVYFSGFYDSCKAIIKTLGMPEDTEIF